MTRKDYRLIAAAVEEGVKQAEIKLGLLSVNVMSFDENQPEAITRREIVEALCRGLWKDNPRFDSGKFRAACGL